MSVQSTAITEEQSTNCSVRGCKRKVTPDSGTKMCEVCRGRHRIYATTKRARRKLEKAAVLGMRRMSDQLDSGVSLNVTIVPGANSDPSAVIPDAENSRWMQAPAPTTTATANWDDGAIDPQLFSASVSPSTSSASAQNSLNYMALHLSSFPPVPYVSSTSSELAGALTLPVPASASTATNVDDTNNNSSYCRPRKFDGTVIQSSPNIGVASGSSAEKRSRPYYKRRPPPSTANEREEENSDESDSDDVDEENDDEHQVTTGDDSQELSTMHTVDGPTRFCSVKGCKAVIPSSYAFKMCPPCRVRYRTYGITKRAKWKAEREAFDRELADLRIKEDERRKLAGERPLSESPEELHAWELSILDEEAPMPPEVLSMVGGTSFPSPMHAIRPFPNGEVASFNTTNPNTVSPSGDVITTDLPPNAVVIQPMSVINTPHSMPPGPQLNQPLLPPNLQLPARMCTVSHCHKLLPGLYRYKRCEQHRLQNRYHSKLKRVREKVVKAVGPTGDEECLVVDNEDMEGREHQEGKDGLKRVIGKKVKASMGEEDKEGEHENGGDAEKLPGASFALSPVESREKGEKEDEEKRSRKRAFRCTSDGCCNLLSPEIRWRNCDICRARERVVKREKRIVEQDAAKELERLRELVRTMEAKSGLPCSGTETREGEMQKSGEADEDAEEDEDVVGEDQVNLNRNGNVDTANGQGEPDVGLNDVAESNSTSLSPEQSTQTAPVPMSTKTTEPVPPPVTISSGSKGGTYHSVFRTTTTPIVSSSTRDVDGNEGKGPRDSTITTTPTILTANLADTDGLTFKAYQPKAASTNVERLLAQNPQLSVQVIKDLLAPKETRANTGLVGSSSYHVYRSTPSPAPARVNPTVPSTPPFVYQPPTKKARTDTSEKQQAQETHALEQGGSMAVTSEPIASGSRAQPPPPSTSTTTTTKRKRPSRAATKPPQPPPQPPASPYPYPNVPSSQYPYTYYVSPYSMPPYGMPPPPRSASTSTSASSPTPAQHPSSSPYPYYYPYPHPYGPPPPGYMYAPPGYLPYTQSQPQLQQLQQQQPQPQPYAPQSLQPGTFPLPYDYPKDAGFNYAHPPPQLKEYSFVVPRQRRPKRKQVDLQPTANTTATALPAATPTSGAAASVEADDVTSPAATGSTVGHLGNSTVSSNAPATDVPAAPETDVARSRSCGNKTCSRTIAAGVAGSMCEKCRLRLKKHQAKAKQRLKLEPRKSVLGIVRGRVE